MNIKRILFFLAFTTSVVVLVGNSVSSDDDRHHDELRQRTRLQAFGPSGGDKPGEGGGILDVGILFGPTRGSRAILKRDRKCLEYRMRTTGLPPGAYTNWWVVFNNPQECASPEFGSRCGLADTLNPATETAIFWATGGTVKGNGVGRFRNDRCIGDNLGFPAIFDPPNLAVPPLQNIQGAGISNPRGAVVWLIVKYHGPVSGDPAVRYHQLHSLLGSCFEGANAFDFGDPFGIQCFDPQVATFNPPKRRHDDDHH